MGGQQPVTGSTIKLYTVGILGNGSAATDILGTGTNGPATSVTSGSDGSFTITGDYTCPVLTPSIPVYLTATGGNPVLKSKPTPKNTSIALVAALGPCDQLLANAASTYINISEATTAAAAWALAPFATSLTNIGASATNIAGITQAMAIANQLVDISDSSSPAPSIIDYAIPETAKLYTLADILASCVNTNGTDGNCSNLLTYAYAGSSQPTDTFSAALDIVQNPTHNVGPLFGLVPASPPYPGLATAPTDWTLTIFYTDDVSDSPIVSAQIQTIDQEGNLWGAGGDYVYEFSPQLVPEVNVSVDNLANSGTSGFNLGYQNSLKTANMSIDPTGNVWLAIAWTYTGDNPGNEANRTGAILEFDKNGNLLSGDGYIDGGIVDPLTAMADTDGYVWVGNSGNFDDPNNPRANANGFVSLGGDVALLSSTGAAQSPSTGWNVTTELQPGVIDFDGLHNAWIINSNPGLPQLLMFPAPIPGAPPFTGPTPATIYPLTSAANDIVFDSLNQGWFSMQSAGSIGEVTAPPTQTLGNPIVSGSGLVYPVELAVDASDRIWTLNGTTNPTAANGYCQSLTLAVFSGGAGQGAPLSTVALGNDLNGCIAGGAGAFLIDNAGSILIDGAGASFTYEGEVFTYTGLARFVGLATPTKTPNTGPPQAP